MTLFGVVGVDAVEADQGVEVDHAAALVFGDLAEGQADAAVVAVLLGLLRRAAGWR